MEKTNTVEEFIANHPGRKEELTILRELALSLPFEESIKWGMPAYTIDGRNVVGIGSFKNWSCLWFHQGVFLDDEAKVLQNAQDGKTKGMRQWRFTRVDEINKELVLVYLQESINNQRAGKEILIDKTKIKLIEVPLLLRTHLDNNLNHLKTFENFTRSQKNEFSNYIIEAKREKTKLNRLEKIKILLENKQNISSLWSA